jgi:hypothetical protein
VISDKDPGQIGSIERERTRSASERSIPAWLVGLTGLGIGLAIALRLLIPNGMDPTILLAFGEESYTQTEYARRLLGEVTTRPGLGHDGKYYFIQANDPWLLSEQTAVLLERPIYRGERMLYPLIAGGFGLLPPRAIVWWMLFSNLLALAIGAWLAAKLALSWDAPAWLGLLVPLNIGLLFELELSGAGILAYTCCLAAVYALERDRTTMASFLFGAAALSREVMIAFAIGVLVLIWREHRRLTWPIVAVPIAAVVAWQVYLRFRIAGAPRPTGGESPFAPPFLGLFEALRVWGTQPGQLIVNGAILAIIVMFGLLAPRSRLPIVWGALPFVGLATVLSAAVWRETFDLTRALSPVFTAVPFLVVVSASVESRALDEGLGAAI